MKVEKRDNSKEKLILTGMIVDRAVVARVAARWTEDLFRTKWCNLVGKWCVDYFAKFDDAPRGAIEGIYESWSDKADEDLVELAGKFLGTLSGEYEDRKDELNANYIIDLAGDYFNAVRLQKLTEAIQGDLATGHLQDAETKLAKYGRVELGGGAGINVLQDKDAIREAFEQAGETVVKYPSAIGSFMRDALERDAFIAFMGPEKRGKSFWLLDLAWRSILQKRKVAFFEVGDMSQNQIMRRFMVRASGRPMKANTLKIPKTIEHDEEGLNVLHETREYKRGLSWNKAWKAVQHIAKDKTGDGGMLRLSCHPNSTLSVHGMSSILQVWEREGWTPDIVVVDYADILAPPRGTVDSRDGINQTWKGLRALSQKLHCLVVTATQADAMSYSAELLTKSNFSEDKRKFAHTTGMIGLNANSNEKDMGVTRLNWLVLREDRFDEQQCVYAAGCLGLANPCIKSTF